MDHACGLDQAARAKKQKATLRWEHRVPCTMVALLRKHAAIAVRRRSSDPRPSSQVESSSLDLRATPSPTAWSSKR